jgi:hypothetical protein
LTVLFLINLTSSFLLLFWPLWFSTLVLRLEKINPFTILMCLSLPFEIMKLYVGPLALIDQGLFDKGYQYALLMGSLYTLMQTLGLVFFYKFFSTIKLDIYFLKNPKFLSKKNIYRSAQIFFLVYIYSMYNLMNGDYGVFNWLLNPREGYQLYRTGFGHWYALSVSALSVSFLLFFLAKPEPRSLLRVTFVHMIMGYFLGSKGLILSIFGASLVFMWFINWRHLNKFLILGAPIIFSILLFNLYLALQEGFDLLAIAKYFDYYKNAADYYNAFFSNEIGLYYGEIFLSSFWSYLPRFIVPDKPFVYGITLINEIFYPGQAELTNTPGFGGAVFEFSDFGLLGIIFYGFFSSKSILLAISSTILFKNGHTSLNKINMGIVIVFLIQYAPGFGAYFPAVLYLFLLVGVIFIISAVKKIKLL